MIEPVKRSNIGDTIVNQIKELILQGKLKINDRLPPERELMEQFEVGRTSLREALKVLESQGLIERSQKGTFISSNYHEFFTDSLMYQFYFAATEGEDILETRRIIEKELAALAAKRATAEDLLEMELSIEAMKAAIAAGTQDGYIASNMRFHEKIAQASKNRVMMDLYNSISNLVLRIQKKAVLVPGVMNQSLAFHKKIYEAIKQGDAIKASVYMEEHMLSVHSTLESKEKVIEKTE